MLRTVSKAAIIAAVCSLPSLASAGPVPVFGPGQARPAVTLVAGGCGWGYHPNDYGNCVANGEGWGRPGYYGPPAGGPRVVVGPRGGAIVCPYGYHLGPHLRECWPN